MCLDCACSGSVLRCLFVSGRVRLAVNELWLCVCLMFLDCGDGGSVGELV